MPRIMRVADPINDVVTVVVHASVERVSCEYRMQEILVSPTRKPHI